MPLLAFAAVWLLLPAQTHAGPRLFGTVEFKTAFTESNGWLEVMKKCSRPVFLDEQRFNTSTLWKNLRRRIEGRPYLEMLRLVNCFWNQWPYRTDQEAYGGRDHWAAPDEFLVKSGDCEDYCIVKYYTLKALGVPVACMRIVVVIDAVSGAEHAILAVYGEDSEIHILDNLCDVVLPARSVRHYEPRFSVNEQHHWVHVKVR